ncbi:hypothetical protein Fmac_025420 [Flemingia macrophylla]|uniref:Uncharacterized protein n=1 Tax=Flemingia macrophylla TaxID=520843 RepID=A0ABD1LS70_9FABA
MGGLSQYHRVSKNDTWENYNSLEKNQIVESHHTYSCCIDNPIEANPSTQVWVGAYG